MGGCGPFSIRYRGSSLAGQFCSLRNPWRGWVAAAPSPSAIGVPRSRVSFARYGTPGADGWLRPLLHPLSGFLARGSSRILSGVERNRHRIDRGLEPSPIHNARPISLQSHSCQKIDRLHGTISLEDSVIPTLFVTFVCFCSNFNALLSAFHDDNHIETVSHHGPPCWKSVLPVMNFGSEANEDNKGDFRDGESTARHLVPPVSL